MIPYLINSTVCLGLLLALYQLLLEKEKMHRFNRFYLLFSIAFSLLVPFISFTVYTQNIAVAQSPALPNLHVQPLLNAPIKTGQNWRGLIISSLVTVYIITTAILLFSYLKSIYIIIRRTAQNEMVVLPGVRIVLLQEEVISHTFLNFIFVSKNQYNQQSLAGEVLSHEFAHVRQKHTLDVLFVGLVQVFFWFNPIIILYKKAIRLNHEFLADDFVIDIYADIKHYQLLLINTISQCKIAAVTSSFNYGITKKRLLMMAKTQNARRAFLKRCMVVICVFTAAYLFSTRVEAKRMIYIHRPAVIVVNKNAGIKQRTLSLKTVEITPKPDKPKANITEQLTSATSNPPDAYVNRAEFNGGLFVTDSVISLYITKNTSLIQLNEYKKQLAEKNISLDISNLKFDEHNNINSVSIRVNCNDGFAGSTGADFEPGDRYIIGFYRSYQKSTKSPFGTGGMPDPLQFVLKSVAKPKI